MIGSMTRVIRGDLSEWPGISNEGGVSWNEMNEEKSAFVMRPVTLTVNFRNLLLDRWEWRGRLLGLT